MPRRAGPTRLISPLRGRRNVPGTARPGRAGRGRLNGPGTARQGRAGRGGGTGLTALATLYPMALDLDGELVADQVYRVQHVGRGVPGAQGHALEVQSRLGDLRLGDRGVALL